MYEKGLHTKLQTCFECRSVLLEGDLFCPGCGSSATHPPKATPSAFCKGCLVGLLPGDVFCLNCGTQVVAAPANAVPGVMSSGLPLAPICSQCRAALLPGDAFCANCGFASALPARNLTRTPPVKPAAPSHSAAFGFPVKSRKVAPKPSTKTVVALAGFGLLAIVLICVASLHPSNSYSESSYQSVPSTSSGYYPATNTYSSPAPVAASPAPQPNYAEPPQSGYSQPPPQAEYNVQPPQGAYYAPPPENNQDQQSTLNEMKEKQQQALDQQNASMQQMQDTQEANNRAQADSLDKQIAALRDQKQALPDPQSNPDAYGGFTSDSFTAAKSAYYDQETALESQISALEDQRNHLK